MFTACLAQCARGAGDYASSCSAPCASSFWSITARTQQRERPTDALGRDPVGERAQIVADAQHELRDGVAVRAPRPNSSASPPCRHGFMLEFVAHFAASGRRRSGGSGHGCAARGSLRSRRLHRRTRVRPAGATAPPSRLHPVRATVYSSPPANTVRRARISRDRHLRLPSPERP